MGIMADTAGKRRAGRADGAGRDKLKKKNLQNVVQ